MLRAALFEIGKKEKWMSCGNMHQISIAVRINELWKHTCTRTHIYTHQASSKEALFLIVQVKVGTVLGI